MRLLPALPQRCSIAAGVRPQTGPRQLEDSLAPDTLGLTAGEPEIGLASISSWPPAHRVRRPDRASSPRPALHRTRRSRPPDALPERFSDVVRHWRSPQPLAPIHPIEATRWAI